LDPDKRREHPLNTPNVYVVAPGDADYPVFFALPSEVWLPNGPNSSWIAPNPYDPYGNGNFTISFNFDLTGTNLATAVFSGGLWDIDDAGYLNLNGNVISSRNNGGYVSMTPFTIPTADLLQGANTLSVVGVNTDNFIEASRLEGTLTIASATSATPLPSTWTMLIVAS
jgi:hypothetical protein